MQHIKTIRELQQIWIQHMQHAALGTSLHTLVFLAHGVVALSNHSARRCPPAHFAQCIASERQRRRSGATSRGVAQVALRGARALVSFPSRVIPVSFPSRIYILDTFVHVCKLVYVFVYFCCLIFFVSAVGRGG